MNIRKQQVMNMHIEKIAYYACYVDCFIRIINEFIENGDSNIKPNDVPNLSELTTKFANHLFHCILNMKRDWEFYK